MRSCSQIKLQLVELRLPLLFRIQVSRPQFSPQLHFFGCIVERRSCQIHWEKLGVCQTRTDRVTTKTLRSGESLTRRLSLPLSSEQHFADSQFFSDVFWTQLRSCSQNSPQLVEQLLSPSFKVELGKDLSPCSTAL